MAVMDVKRFGVFCFTAMVACIGRILRSVSRKTESAVNKMQVCHAQVFNQQSQCKHTSAMAMAVEYQSCHVEILVQVQDRETRIADLQKT